MHQLSGARFDWKQLTSPSHLVSVLTKQPVPCGCLRKIFVVSGSHCFSFVLLNAEFRLAFIPGGWDKANRKRAASSWERFQVCAPLWPHINIDLLDPSLSCTWGLIIPFLPFADHCLGAFYKAELWCYLVVGPPPCSFSGDFKLPEGRHLLQSEPGTG